MLQVSTVLGGGPVGGDGVEAVAERAVDRIVELRVYGYDLTYAHDTYVMSKGRAVSVLTSTVVAVRTESGTTGYAEVCPLGTTYLPGFSRGVVAVLEELAPFLIGVDAGNLHAVSARMEEALVGHAYAKSVVDVACWDALGKRAGLPCSLLLGGTTQDEFPLYVAVPLASPEQMAEFVAAARADGIHRFQLKIGGNPERDAQRARAVVEATGEGDVIVCDANGGWCLQDATIAVRLLEDLPRVRVEQPCRTIEECLTVRRLTSLPLILDEVITDVQALLRCHNAGAMDAVNLKISRLGGLSAARTVRDLATELGLRVTIEDTWGGDLTTAAVSHLAASTPERSFFAASFMNDWTLEHVAGYEPRSRRGHGSGPAGPGLGVEVDEERLGRPIFVFDGVR